MKRKKLISMLLVIAMFFSAIQPINIMAANSTHATSAKNSPFNPLTESSITFSYQMEKPHLVKAYIRAGDSTNKTDEYVKIIFVGTANGGYVDNTITWDGKGESGAVVPAGTYTAWFEVQEPEWAAYKKTIFVTFKVAYETNYTMEISPNLNDDVFYVSGNCDSTFDKVEIELGGDVMPAGDVEIVGDKWTMLVSISDYGLATIDAYKVAGDSREFIGSISVIKHVVNKESKVVEVAEIYYEDTSSGESAICALNAIKSSDGLISGNRLLVPDATKADIQQAIEEARREPKFSIELLHTAGVFSATVFSKDPVNLATGNFVYANTDIQITGAFPLSFTRFYNTISDFTGFTGYNWSNEYNVRLMQLGEGAVAVVHSDGHWDKYTLDGGAQLVSTPDVLNKLEFDGEGYTLTFPDNTQYFFNDSGDLAKIIDINGNETRLEYDGGMLSSVSTGSGSLFFSFDGSLVSQISDNAGRSVSYEYEGKNLIGFTDVNGNRHTYTYDEEDRLLTVVNPLNNMMVINVYDEQSRDIAQSFPDGGSMQYAYDEGMTTQTEQNGNVVRFYFDDKYRVYKEEYADGTIEKVFDDQNNVTSYKDKNNNLWYYTYDNNGNVLTETNPLGQTTSYTYNELSKVTSITQSNGAASGFEYDSRGNLVMSSDALGNRITLNYNGQGLLTGSVDKRGGTTTISYDSRGNISTVTDSAGKITRYEYDGLNQVSRITMPEGNSTSFSYTNTGKIDTITDGNGSYSKYSYDAADNLISVRDFNGSTTKYEYDAMNHPAKITDALGHSREFEYDLMWNIVKETNENGNSDVYSYDLLNRLESATDANGNVTRYYYDSNNNVTKIVNPLNQPEEIVYDGLNRQVSTVNKAGNSGSVVYDSAGNIISSTDFMGITTRYEYDFGNRLTLVTDALGNETSYRYDENGNVVAIIDALGYITAYEYNSLNKISAVTDPMGGRTEMLYDGNGNIVRVTDPEGNVSKFEYDKLDRLSVFTDAEGGTAAYVYDANGNMTVTRDARGNETKTSYNANNKASGFTDESGFVSVVTYDPEGRVSSVKNARNAQTAYEYDANGNITALTDALGNVTRFGYDALNRLVKITDARGNSTSITYKATDEIETVTDALGGVTRYEYDAMGRELLVQSPMNYQTVSEYDSIGRLVKTIDAEGNSTEYSYDSLGRITQKLNADGTFVKYAYNSNGWLTDVWNEDGAVVSYKYDKNGNITKITDALGYDTSYSYDKLGRTTAVTDALNGVTKYAYDANGNLVSVTDALNQTTRYEYDKKNQVIAYTDAKGYVTRMTYDANGNIATATNPDGGVTTFTYDLLDRLVSYTDGEGYTFTQKYDANGNIINTTDGRGNTKGMSYDALNRLIALTDEKGFTSHTVYDVDGRVTRYTNNEGAVTYYEYDKNSNITKVTDVLGNSTSFIYDSMNRVVSATNARGAVTKYTYTPTGSLASITDALNGVYKYEYDILGRLVKETNENSESTEYTYDALGRVTSVKNPLGHSDKFAYDAVNRISSVTDKNGNVTKYRYDANSNVIETIDALNHSSYFEYDEMNWLTKVTLWRDDAQDNVHEQQVTLYSYDKRGLVTKEINAAGDNTVYVYDGNGNLAQKTDADGYVTNYSFGATNLVEAINYADGKEAQFAYNKNGELVAMMDWNGTVNFTLDLLGRITSVNDHNEMITGYTYDSVGNQTAIKYPDNTVVAYAYDLLNRMTGMKDAENQNTVYAYDAASQLISQAYPNGWKETKQYDAAGQLIRQYSEHPDSKTNHSIEHTYTYDPQGNILTEYRSGAGGQDRFNLVHTYDALNRLTSTTGDQGYKNHVYTYDSLGNLTYEKIANSKSTDYKYNNLNQQVQKIVDGKDQYTISYDKRGNQVKEVYNKKPGDASKDEIVASYLYDASNRMVKGTNAAGEQSFYIYDGLGNLVGNEWIIAKSSYGYTGASTEPSAQVGGVVVCDRHKNTTGQGHINPTGKGHTTGGTAGSSMPVIDGKKYQVVHKDYVLDYTSALGNVIMETESGVGGLTYRSVYGLRKVETVIYGIPNGAGSVMQSYTYGDNGAKTNVVKLYHHQNAIGTTDYLTDNVAGKVTSYVTYDDWGALTAKAVLKMGVRELDLVQDYTGHFADMVLGVYYAKARMYDAGDRRFMATDPVRGSVTDPKTMIPYVYVVNNPIRFIDPTGEYYIVQNGENVVKTRKATMGDRGSFDSEGNVRYTEFVPDGTYTIVKDSQLAIGARTISKSFMPFLGLMEAVIYEGFHAVGGTSVKTKGEVAEDALEDYIKLITPDILMYIFSGPNLSIIIDAASTAFDIFESSNSILNVIPNMSKTRLENIAIDLMIAKNVSLTSDSIEVLIRQMAIGVEYIKFYRDYFVDSSSLSLTNGQSTKLCSQFKIDSSLMAMTDESRIATNITFIANQMLLEWTKYGSVSIAFNGMYLSALYKDLDNNLKIAAYEQMKAEIMDFLSDYEHRYNEMTDSFVRSIIN